jgi:hypothetical protein
MIEQKIDLTELSDDELDLVSGGAFNIGFSSGVAGTFNIAAGTATVGLGGTVAAVGQAIPHFVAF